MALPSRPCPGRLSCGNTLVVKPTSVNAPCSKRFGTVHNSREDTNLFYNNSANRARSPRLSCLPGRMRKAASPSDENVPQAAGLLRGAGKRNPADCDTGPFQATIACHRDRNKTGNADWRLRRQPAFPACAISKDRGATRSDASWRAPVFHVLSGYGRLHSDRAIQFTAAAEGHHLQAIEIDATGRDLPIDEGVAGALVRAGVIGED
jgi:hypothetical protein